MGASDVKLGRTATETRKINFADTEAQSSQRFQANPDRALLRTDTNASLSSIRSGNPISRRNTIEPRSAIPIEYRTISIQINEGKKAEQRPIVTDLSEVEWHTLSIEEVVQRLSTSPSVGLEQSQIERKLKESGKNILSPPPRNYLKKFAKYVLGGFGSLLLLASILCFIAWKPLGEPAPSASNLALAVLILIVVVISAVFNWYQDYSSGKVLDSITGMLPSEVSVLRGGSSTRIPAANLVPGDIVEIGLGQKIPADMRICEHSSDLKFDRSILTGESDPIDAKVQSTSDNYLETKNIALQGTLVVSGSGKGVVVSTGDHTVFGKIAKVSSKPKAGLTTLEYEILRFVLTIAALALILDVLVVALWAGWIRKDHPGFISTAQLIINVVSVAVAFVPEGLPVCVTLSLSKIASSLSKERILCKSLATVETLGSMNVLCTDKTGTLTANKMTVVNFHVFGKTYTSAEGRDCLARRDQEARSVKTVQIISSVCNGAKFEASTERLDPLAPKPIAGDATDSAILRFSDFLADAELARNRFSALFTQSFSSATKFMIKVVAPNATCPPEESAALPSVDGHRIMLVKGAPDILLKRSAYVYDPVSGGSLVLSEENLRRIQSVQEEWASRGQRVLLLARKQIPISEHAYDSPEYADFVARNNFDLEVVGLVGIIDPPRPEVPEAIRVCRSAGVRVFMVTGDFALTAAAIAAQCGIVTDASRVDRFGNLQPQSDLKEKSSESHADKDVGAYSQSLVLEGTDLMKMTENDWDAVCAYEEVVFSRTSPDQKMRIVKELQKRGCCVGMTGDGVNDSPSLKAADIGVAIGGGSDVAIEAADLVLLESFASITVAIQRGRLVFDNLQKLILYLLPAGSFSELMPILLNAIFGLPQILSNLQMIIICVATDVLPALSLVMESPEADLLARPPRNPKTDRLVSARVLLHAYGFLGLLESLCANSMAWWYMQRGGIRFSEMFLKFGAIPEGMSVDYYNERLYEAQSIYFYSLVIMQFGNLLASRTRKLSILQQNPFRGIGKNVYLFPAMAMSLAIASFFSYVPFFNHTFLTRGVSVEHWFIPVAFGLGLLLLDESRKALNRAYPKSILAWLAW